MLRFRLGQSWKREDGGRPVDAFALELDGVNLLRGAIEESLERVVPDWVDALGALQNGACSAQVSLPDAHLELVLTRKPPEEDASSEDASEVELCVVSLGRPARLMRPPVRVEFAELCAALARCVQGLHADLLEQAPASARTPRFRRALKRAVELTTRPPRPVIPLALPRPRPLEASPSRTSWGFGVSFEPAGARQRKARTGTGKVDLPGAPLGVLLGRGRVWLGPDEASPAWAAEGHPFLLALELSRQAAELVEALEAHEPRFELQFGGVGPSAVLHLQSGELVLSGARLPVSPRMLAGAMLELGEALSVAFERSDRALRQNSYLSELRSRCRDGLSHLRGAAAPPPLVETPNKRRPARRSVSPLAPSGRLRRLRFEPLWERPSAGNTHAGGLVLGPHGPVFVSPTLACAFSATGDVLFRRVATHGVASSADGQVLTASATQLRGFYALEATARWLRDHDGLYLGPHLEQSEGILVGIAQGTTVAAYSDVTGRELWRLTPPRVQQTHLALQGHRALLTTDTGYLYGLDLMNGQVRFRMRAALPFLGPTTAWGTRLVAWLGRGEQTAILVADAHSGKLHWATEMALSRPSAPVVSNGRVYAAGERDGKATLACLGKKGELRWERTLPLGEGPYALTSCGRSVVLSSRRGAAVAVNGEGGLEWRLGDAGAELGRLIAPPWVRGVLFLPGETLRAVDPQGGSVLAEVRGGLGLCHLVVDPKLNLYLLDDEGTVRAFRLATHLALVSGA